MYKTEQTFGDCTLEWVSVSDASFSSAVKCGSTKQKKIRNKIPEISNGKEAGY
jgi:hypothetical protein